MSELAGNFGVWAGCTAEECEAMPTCAVCSLRKKPRGRSAGLEAASSYCDPGCRGYAQDPEPGHLWPGELARIREDEEERNNDDSTD